MVRQVLQLMKHVIFKAPFVLASNVFYQKLLGACFLKFVLFFKAGQETFSDMKLVQKNYKLPYF